MNIVIMAGGGGTRLWPLSRKNTPKQFIDLGSGKTLIEHTYDRARQLTDAGNIFVATTEQYEDKILQTLPNVPADHIFMEPEKRDTAPAIAAAAIQLKLQGRANDPALFMWSDHVFTNEDQFLSDLKKIPDLVQENPDHIVIVGHVPTFPETGLGYIEAAPGAAGQNKHVRQVKSFREKPDQKTAEEYVTARNFFWNMGYVTMLPEYLLAQLDEHEPKLMSVMAEYEQNLAAGDKDAAARTYAKAEKISIDYALLEKTPRILVITGDYGWSDVGNWAAVQEIFGKRGDHGPRGSHVHINSEGNYIYNSTNKTVTCLGIKDTIIVVTDDAILVTTKDDSHKVKEAVAKLEEDNSSAV